MSPEDATVVHRARLQVENWLHNVRRVGELRYTLHEHRASRGFTAFVVGAGPSLNRNGWKLTEASERATVLSVNSSLGSVAVSTGKSICVAIENVDVTAHLGHRCDHIIAAGSAHPEVFDAAIRSGGSWFLECSPHVLSMARLLSVEPVAHGGAAVPTAVELAALLGATTIVLVGCDLAFGSDGAAYAKGAGWDGLTVSEQDGSLRFEGRPDRDETHHRCGVPAVWRSPDAIQVPAWGRGMTVTKRDYLLQAEWLSAFARRHSEVTCLNATEGGMAIAEWHPVTMVDALERADLRPMPYVRTSVRLDPSRAIAEIGAEIDRAERFFAAYDGGVPDFSDAVRGFPLVEAMAAADLIRLRREELKYQARNRAIYEVLRAAAAECRRVFHG